jgi:uncharacterized protein (DUF302 family)
MASAYGFGVSLAVPYEEALGLVKDALKAEGFGVLSEIDVQKTLREKIGAEMPAYMIYGACNPPLAHKALTAEQDIGLLLPCNVVVRAEGNGSRVEVADPEVMFTLVDNASLKEVADDAKSRLKRVVEALSREHATSR